VEKGKRYSGNRRETRRLVAGKECPSLRQISSFKRRYDHPTKEGALKEQKAMKISKKRSSTNKV